MERKSDIIPVPEKTCELQETKRDRKTIIGSGYLNPRKPSPTQPAHSQLWVPSLPQDSVLHANNLFLFALTFSLSFNYVIDGTEQCKLYTLTPRI